ncbi:MAG TPA: HoxN/HupN/NixA family nickel/cobalt transporter [Gemmatimonadaceae bacterium]|nr:HoxN/HupN/NixA family nickel/cobalt transporter [Gemmatimonadaceae bacterium]
MPRCLAPASGISFAEGLMGMQTGGGQQASETSPAGVAGIAGGVVVLHVLGWGAALLYIARGNPFLLSLVALAYVLGLRHGFDADHIAAIDSTTRKLIRDQRSPLGTGFFFSLGHSTVVLLLTLATVFAARAVKGDLPRLQQLGGYIGTTVSGLFMYAVGLLNLLLFLEVYRTFRALRRGRSDAEALDRQLLLNGFMSRVFGRFLKLVARPWHLYPVGFLFGLGFDTASEVALLALAAMAASHSLPMTALLVLPLVFAAGMSLVDTVDGVLMSRAYRWALVDPVRKLVYNLAVTGVTVAVALFIGSVQFLSIAGQLLGWQTGIWAMVRALDFETLGIAIVALFMTLWIAAWLVRRFGRAAQRWTELPDEP